MRDSWNADELVFLPLGGSGEIGMNLNLYGFGGKWLMVDLGLSFADETLPGVDLITPDPTFIAERRDDLVGIVLTHAHEDHLGAVPYLWPMLRKPVYATAFTAAVLRRKLAETDFADEVPIVEVPLGGSIDLDPFAIDFISMTHSIAEANALAIRTPVGTVLHTGDWKIDPTPLIGDVTDEPRLTALGDDGVLALVCDSTNVFNPGESGSEAAVRESLSTLVDGLPNRVAITTFASNVARVATVAEVARRHGRHLSLVGRSLWRIVDAAREAGYLKDFGTIVPDEEAAYLPPDKVLYLCTGCQGEPRGAMGRIAAGGHPHVVLEDGDTAIFSSKIIPGNELPIARLQNQLIEAGVRVITERDHFVHVSGHPNRDELQRMYQWARPQKAVPVHGETRHLVAHAALARELQVPQVKAPENGRVMRLGPGDLATVGEVQSGRWIVDGKSLAPITDQAIRDRRKLMYNGTAVITLVADAKGELMAPPRLLLRGIIVNGKLEEFQEDICEAVEDAIEDLPRGARADDGRVAEAARRAIRRMLREEVGKRPVIETQIIRV